MNHSEIIDRIKYVHDVDVTEDMLKEFEQSPYFKEGLSEKEYTKTFLAHYMDLEEVYEEVGTATMGNTSGMGAVVTPIASGQAGQAMADSGANTPFSTPLAGDTYSDGGKVGSGDVAAGSNMKRKEYLPKSRRKSKIQNAVKQMGKNIKNQFKEGEFQQGGTKKASKFIKSFTDFTKNEK